MNTSIERAEVHRAIKGHDWAIFSAAGLSFFMSVYLWFSGDTDAGLYIGIWVPSILSLGNYLKWSMEVQRGA